MKYIRFQEAKDILEKKAYDWAVREQQRLGCIAEPIFLEFDSDCLTSDRDSCVASVFYDYKTKKAILRRDWLDDMGIKDNILTNLDEIQRIAPMSAAYMLNNGIKLYRYYDGPTGGVTRKMEKEWI